MKLKKFPILLLLPSLLIILTTVIYPILRTFIYSMQNLKLTEPENVKFIGFENYKKVVTSKEFHTALINSSIILVIVVILGLIISLITGLLLSKNSKISPLLTGIAIIPWALPPIVNSIIWEFIFYPGYGLINKLLINFKILEKPIAWTTNLYTTLFVVAVVVVWKHVPFCSILILSSLKNINKDLYEAATVDGCSKFQQFKEITLPLLVPSLAIVVIQLIMGGINVFDEMVTIAGYKFDSATLLIYNYMNTFNFLDFGFGSAITYTIMILSGIIGYFYIKNIAKE